MRRLCLQRVHYRMKIREAKHKAFRCKCHKMLKSIQHIPLRLKQRKMALSEYARVANLAKEAAKSDGPAR